MDRCDVSVGGLYLARLVLQRILHKYMSGIVELDVFGDMHDRKMPLRSSRVPPRHVLVMLVTDADGPTS